MRLRIVTCVGIGLVVAGTLGLVKTAYGIREVEQLDGNKVWVWSAREMAAIEGLLKDRERLQSENERLRKVDCKSMM